MGGSALLTLMLATSPICTPGPGPALPTTGPVTDATLEAIYKEGVPFDQFLEDADRRRELWDRNYHQGQVPDHIVRRAQALPGTWRLLAVAEDWCSDSVNTIPFLALLAEAVETVELRVVDSEVGEEIMNAHLTPDGRPATPTILVLDEAYDEAGCWVERPSELQAWAMENRESLGEEFGPQKMAWYREDAGSSTLEEVMSVLEGAAAGSPVCVKG